MPDLIELAKQAMERARLFGDEVMDTSNRPLSPGAPLRESIANAPVLGGALGMAKGPMLMSDQELLEQATPGQRDVATKYSGLNRPQGFIPTELDVADMLRGFKTGEAYAGERNDMGGEGVSRLIAKMGPAAQRLRQAALERRAKQSQPEAPATTPPPGPPAPGARPAPAAPTPARPAPEPPRQPDVDDGDLLDDDLELIPRPPSTAPVPLAPRQVTPSVTKEQQWAEEALGSKQDWSEGLSEEHVAKLNEVYGPEDSSKKRDAANMWLGRPMESQQTPRRPLDALDEDPTVKAMQDKLYAENERAKAEAPARQPRGFYAGIGSRRTPPHIQDLMTSISGRLADEGYVLRSGAAKGADSAFERGAPGDLDREIYLPQAGFEGRVSGPGYIDAPTPEAIEAASKIHPNWPAVVRGGWQNLHGRNMHQILGGDLKSPSKFVIAWTPDGADGVNIPVGRDTGGTGQAIRAAVANGIKVYNLGNPETLARFQKYVQGQATRIGHPEIRATLQRAGVDPDKGLGPEPEGGLPEFADTPSRPAWDTDTVPQPEEVSNYTPPRVQGPGSATPAGTAGFPAGDTPLVLTDGTVIGRGYARVVHGGRGDYVELAPEHIDTSALTSKYGDPNAPLPDRAFYRWMEAGPNRTKVYQQAKPVGYADYKPGMYYVDPKDLQGFDYPGRGQAVAPQTPTPAPSAPTGERPSLRSSMTFAFKPGEARPEVTAPTTFEAILRGERTSTTRHDSWKGANQWKDAKPGDYVEFNDGKGNTVNVRITGINRIDLANATPEQLEAWSKAEGWTPEYGRAAGKRHGPATQITYERADPPALEPLEGGITQAEMQAQTGPIRAAAKRRIAANRKAGIPVAEDWDMRGGRIGPGEKAFLESGKDIPKDPDVERPNRVADKFWETGNLDNVLNDLARLMNLPQVRGPKNAPPAPPKPVLPGDSHVEQSQPPRFGERTGSSDRSLRIRPGGPQPQLLPSSPPPTAGGITDAMRDLEARRYGAGIEETTAYVPEPLSTTLERNPQRPLFEQLEEEGPVLPGGKTGRSVEGADEPESKQALLQNTGDRQSAWKTTQAQLADSEGNAVGPVRGFEQESPEGLAAVAKRIGHPWGGSSEPTGKFQEQFARQVAADEERFYQDMLREAGGDVTKSNAYRDKVNNMIYAPEPRRDTSGKIKWQKDENNQIVTIDNVRQAEEIIPPLYKRVAAQEAEKVRVAKVNPGHPGWIMKQRRAGRGKNIEKPDTTVPGWERTPEAREWLENEALAIMSMPKEGQFYGMTKEEIAEKAMRNAANGMANKAHFQNPESAGTIYRDTKPARGSSTEEAFEGSVDTEYGAPAKSLSESAHVTKEELDARGMQSTEDAFSAKRQREISEGSYDETSTGRLKFDNEEDSIEFYALERMIERDEKIIHTLPKKQRATALKRIANSRAKQAKILGVSEYGDDVQYQGSDRPQRVSDDNEAWGLWWMDEREDWKRRPGRELPGPSEPGAPDRWRGMRGTVHYAPKNPEGATHGPWPSVVGGKHSQTQPRSSAPRTFKRRMPSTGMETTELARGRANLDPRDELQGLVNLWESMTPAQRMEKMSASERARVARAIATKPSRKSKFIARESDAESESSTNWTSYRNAPPGYRPGTEGAERATGRGTGTTKGSSVGVSSSFLAKKMAEILEVREKMAPGNWEWVSPAERKTWEQYMIGRLQRIQQGQEGGAGPVPLSELLKRQH